MRKIIYLLAVSVWLWVACAGGAATHNESDVAGAAPTATREIKTDFVATDPGTVQLAAGQPQLVEFFAVW